MNKITIWRISVKYSNGSFVSTERITGGMMNLRKSSFKSILAAQSTLGRTWKKLQKCQKKTKKKVTRKIFLSRFSAFDVFVAVVV